MSTKPLTVRADSGTPHPRRVRGLDTVADVKREAGALYRAGRKGDVAAGDASKLATILTLILRCTETADLERRMQQIEERLAERAKP